nr:hypothetical protein [Tanacetum cinerariifolium]
MSSYYEFNCYGCGRPLDTPVCYLCTYGHCGNILSYGTCLNCNFETGNSFTYDTIPKSFDEVPNPPPQYHFNIYLCQICESNSHYGYECSQRVPLVYEPEPCYIQNFSNNDYSHDLPSVNPLIDHHCCYECGNSLNEFFCYQCTCEFCGNGAHVGYNCPAQVHYFQTLPSFPQQYPCCEDCGVTHEPYQCQPKNHDYYHEQNSCYDSNSFGFDHGQTPRYTIIQRKQEEKQIEEEQAANAQYWKIPACCDDDDDYNSAITPNEPIDSLSMGDKHLDTIPATGSDEFIKSCVENLVPNPRINETDCHPKNEIRLIERLLYDNSSPRPPEEFVSKNSYAEIESFSPSPIPIEDSDYLMKEMDLSCTPNDPMPLSIEDDDNDSERDILILNELPNNYSLSLPVNELFNFDIPSFSRPPAKPPDGNT